MVAKRSWLRKIACTLPGIGLAGWLAWSSWQAHAQDIGANPGVAKAYLNKTTFHLPILIDERHRAQLESVHLYVKEGAAQPWKLCDKAPPTQTSFTYRAAQEGEYWFNIVSMDKAGRMTPADVTKEAPALIVVLDTQPPQVDLQPLHSAPEGQYVRCTWRDGHLDSFKSRVFYQTGDQVWRPLDAQPGKADTFCIPAQAAWTGNIRAVAVDLAGNTTTREMNLSNVTAAAVPPVLPMNPPPAATPPFPPFSRGGQGGGAVQQTAVAPVPAATAPPMPEVNQPQAVTLPTWDGFPNPSRHDGLGNPSHDIAMPTRGRPISAQDVIVPPLAVVGRGVVVVDPLPPLVPPPSIPEKIGTQNVTSRKITSPVAAPAVPQLFDPAVAQKSPAIASGVDVKTTAHLTREPVSIQRQFSNTARLFLDYRIEALGASGVGKVEVWYTRDLGQSWQKLCEDNKRQSPAEINLPGDGIYGVSLVISNGRGFGGTPPVPGDTPDSWIEVDTTKPIAELVQIRAGTGDDSGALHIAWSARDKNLTSDSVELQYAAAREGPWQIIAKGLKSEGIYRWVPPVEVGPHAFIRLTVRDQANNVAAAETPQPVPLDDASRPRGRVLGISSAAPRTNSPLPGTP